MTVRALRPDDAAAFQALRLRGLGEAPTAFASSLEEEVSTPIDQIEWRLRPQDDRAIFGALGPGGLCGVLGVQREAMRKLQHKGFIWGMYVAPEARRAGHGLRLMQAALAHAWAVLQVRQVNLGVHALNDGAVRLYQRCGFEVYGTERGSLLVDGVPQDEHHMVCSQPQAVPPRA